jgi:histidine ammonia-lyase
VKGRSAHRAISRRSRTCRPCCSAAKCSSAANARGALDGLCVAGLAPLTLQAKEGLALLNGTQASTALALDNMFAIEDLYRTALVAGALSVDAAAGSVKPFDARIHELRGHRGQIDAAASYRELLEGSPINQSHRDCEGAGPVQPALPAAGDGRVPGPDAPRGRRAAGRGERRVGQPADLPGYRRSAVGRQLPRGAGRVRADNLALAAAEIGALAERRIALLIDATLSGLPPFLVRDGGVNSAS